MAKKPAASKAEATTETRKASPAGRAAKKESAPASKSTKEAPTRAREAAAAKAPAKAPAKTAAKAPAKEARATTEKAPPTASSSNSSSAGSGTASRNGSKAKAATPKHSAEDSRYLKKYGEKLSKSTQRAKWIGSTDEHAERPGQTLATRNQEVIRRWAEEREAMPATVASTERSPRAGVLRFDFPGGSQRQLKPISWEEWFTTFEDRHLVFLYQETLRKGNQSNFFRLDNPDREDG